MERRGLDARRRLIDSSAPLGMERLMPRSFGGVDHSVPYDRAELDHLRMCIDVSAPDGCQMGPA
jgi:hypothetical protein